MASELWQRLRAARKGADLRQTDLATAMGITRSGYAFLETPHAEARTRPSVEQVQIVAEKTGVPVHMLLDDTVDLDDIVRVQMPGAARPAPPMPQVPEEIFSNVLQAIKFTVGAADPARMPHFSAAPSVGPLPVPVEYMSGRAAAVVVGEPSLEETRAALGRLFLVEKLAGRSLTKLLVVWTRHRKDLTPLIDAALSQLGVMVRVVTSPGEAAEAILSLK